MAASVPVTDTTAAIDAVRNNSEIYVPIFSDHIILSPLSGYDDFFTYVSEPNELGRLIDDHYADSDLIRAVSYTHLTLPTNREV